MIGHQNDDINLQSSSFEVIQKYQPNNALPVNSGDGVIENRFYNNIELEYILLILNSFHRVKPSPPSIFKPVTDISIRTSPEQLNKSTGQHLINIEETTESESDREIFHKPATLRPIDWKIRKV